MDINYTNEQSLGGKKAWERRCRTFSLKKPTAHREINLENR